MAGSGLLVLQQAQEVGAVAGLHQGLGAPAQALVVDEAHTPGDLLGGADIEALTVLDGADEAGGVGQRVEGTGVEPAVPRGRTSTVSLPASR